MNASVASRETRASSRGTAARGGDFSSGSFIAGASVVLEIQTDNGTISFHGTADQSGQISGDFVISNSTCNQTGTAVFVAVGQWDYCAGAIIR